MALKSNETLVSISLVLLEHQYEKCGGNCFTDVKKMKVKSPLKQMEVDDSPITLHEITVKHHFFRDVIVRLLLTSVKMPSLSDCPDCSCSET